MYLKKPLIRIESIISFLDFNLAFFKVKGRGDLFSIVFLG